MGVLCTVTLPPASPLGGGRFAFWTLAVRALLLACAFSLAPASLWAQADEEPQSADSNIPQITIRAEGKKEEAPRRDSIAPANVITREKLESRADDVPQVLEESVGAQVREIGGFGSYSTLSIRGSSPDQVRVYLDGVPLDRGTSGTVDLSSVPIENLERIEIYRGVTPLSVGGSAIGGVVEFTSRRPEKNRAEIYAGGGSFGWRRAGLSLARAEEGEPWAATLGLSYEGAENDFAFTSANGTPANPLDDFERKQRNADYNKGDALFQISRDLPRKGSLSLIEVFRAREAGITPGDLLLASNRRLLDVQSTTSVRVDLPELTTRSALKAQAYFGFLKSSLTDVAELTDDRDYLAGISADYRYDLADAWRAEAFGEYRFEVFDPSGTLAATPVGPSSRRHFYTVAAGLEYEPVPEELLLVAQVRYEAARDRLRDSNAGNAALPVADLDGVTGRGGMRWRPGKGVTFSVNIARAVRLPNFTELFGNTLLIRGDPTLREEESLNVDAGITLETGEQPWAREASFEIRYFHNDVDNTISFVSNSVGVLIVTNLPGSRSDGVEVSARWRGPRLFVAEGNATWLRARLKPGGVYDVPFSPEWQAYVRGGIEDDLNGALSKAGLWVDFEYVSKNFLGQANLGEVPERPLLGAGLSAEFFDGELRLLFEARNLAGEKGLYNFAGFPLPGRTFLGTARWKFI